MTIPPLKRKRLELLAEYWADKNVTYATLERKCGVCFETAKRWLDRFRAGDESCEGTKPPGRPCKLSTAERKAVKRHMRRKHGATLSTATRMLNKNRATGDQVHLSTVRRAMAVLKHTERQHKNVSRTNREKRRKATTRGKVSAMRKVLRNVCFTDASYVRYAPGQFVRPHRFEKGWELPGTPAREYDPTKYKLIGFYGGIISPKEGVVKHTPLFFIPEGQALNAPYYQRGIVPQFDAWGKAEVGEDLQLWLQDNAPAHIAKTTGRALLRRGMKLLDHTPQSPDLNPIEKCWAVFKLLIADRRPRTWAGFEKAMQQEWHNAVLKRGESAILELPAAMQKVHEKPDVHVKNVKS
jgi:transposase